jgi:hypothetical protein
MPYTNGDGTYHDRRRCRRLHNTGRRIRRIDDAGDRDPCPHCIDDTTPEVASIEAQIEAGECPWCDREDRYEGDHVGQHASSAHPEAWAEYRK